MVQEIGTLRETVQRMMKVLTEQRKIERIGDKRFGRWEVRE